jgi:TRAP transporter TAXI family solute receptor
MKNKKNTLATLMLLAISAGAFSQMTILSGPSKATHYSFVDNIAMLAGTSLDFKIVNQESNGSSFNLDQLTDPKSPYKLAILQADFLYYMQSQDMRLNTEKTKDLKVVLPLGYEQIHLVTKSSKGYTGLKDLEGKVVAIGSNEQGTYRTAFLIMERSKMNWIARNTHFDDCLAALNTNNIDAFFIVSSAPIEKLNINPQTQVDELALVQLENFNDWAKYYMPDTIHKTDYKWLEQDIPTFSVPGILVVNESKLSPEERDNVMKLKSAIQSNIENLKAKGHPEWNKVNLMDWEETDWPTFK